MRQLLAALDVVSSSDAIVTLVGETGSGKELLARRLHARSMRSKSPFVAINCAAIPETLFESELFGYERGAFTGASSRTIGKVEAAQGGTLFLDEIAELPLSQQAKLLRFLEHRMFMRVGGVRKIPADVRVVCATLRSLELEVAAGRFRADLYFRIQGLEFVVPPLRERREDIVPLIDQLLRALASQHHVAKPRLTRQARDALLAYHWPGNVRELKNVLERGCLLRAGRSLRVADLPKSVTALDEKKTSTSAAKAPRGGAGIRPLEQTICAAIEAALVALPSTAAAARALEISQRTIQRYVSLGKVRVPRRRISSRST